MIPVDGREQDKESILSKKITAIVYPKGKGNARGKSDVRSRFLFLSN
jgi:hypothetical protein